MKELKEYILEGLFGGSKHRSPNKKTFECLETGDTVYFIYAPARPGEDIKAQKLEYVGEDVTRDKNFVKQLIFKPLEKVNNRNALPPFKTWFSFNQDCLQSEFVIRYRGYDDFEPCDEYDICREMQDCNSMEALVIGEEGLDLIQKANV